MRRGALAGRELTEWYALGGTAAVTPGGAQGPRLRGAMVAPVTTEFASLALLPELLAVVTELGYTRPTPVQAQSIPALLTQFLEHPLGEQLTSYPFVKEAMRQPSYLRLRAAVSLVEARIGRRWPEIVRGAAGQGIAVGFDAATKGVVMLVRAQEEEMPLGVPQGALVPGCETVDVACARWRDGLVGSADKGVDLDHAVPVRGIEPEIVGVECQGSETAQVRVAHDKVLS